VGPPDRVRGAETGRTIGPADTAGSDTAGWPVGWFVEHVVETGSTNADLIDAAEAGAPDRTVLYADHQTAGRGRLDRVWTAPPAANLLVSILLRDVPEDPGELTRRVGVAAVHAVRDIAGVTAGLKWPNDVLVDGAKLAGILAQRAADGAVVIGMGLNVRWAPEGAARLGDRFSPRSVLRAVLAAYDRLPAEIEQAYRAALDTIGRRVRVRLPAGELIGTALDVTDDGRLVVADDDGETHRLSVGDVVHVRRV
jgi:BirA family biotin operon repressor/biotin-[acetyl-CoA-carboxylase] ligase